MTEPQRRKAGAPADRPATRDDPDIKPGRESGTGPPRWVAVLAIAIGVILAVLIFILHLTGGLGPGAH